MVQPEKLGKIQSKRFHFTKSTLSCSIFHFVLISLTVRFESVSRGAFSTWVRMKLVWSEVWRIWFEGCWRFRLFSNFAYQIWIWCEMWIRQCDYVLWERWTICLRRSFGVGHFSIEQLCLRWIQQRVGAQRYEWGRPGGWMSLFQVIHENFNCFHSVPGEQFWRLIMGDCLRIIVGSTRQAVSLPLERTCHIFSAIQWISCRINVLFGFLFVLYSNFQ